MISVELAGRLRTAGLTWTPAPGDRFVIADRDMDDEVFVVSELTIDVHEAPTGRLFRFNGTTEWALDSVTLDQALWLPREDQLRELLGDRLEAVRRLERGWEVTYAVKQGYVRTVTDPDLECAYAKALVTL